MTGIKTFLNDMFFVIIFGAIIGLTVGIVDTFLATPVDPFLFLATW